MNDRMNIHGDVVVLGRYIKGAGNRFVLVITYDDADDLGEALKNVVADIGVGKTNANEASDTYAYGFEIEKKRLPHDICDPSPDPSNYPKTQIIGETMKTFQIFKNVSYEYFIEAETLEEAQNKIIEENPEPESEDLIEWVFADEHDGVNWTYEPVTHS